MLCLDDAAWDYVGIVGREVRIVFDADAAWKADVGVQERRLAEYLRGRGARVAVLRLPSGGLDDYLARGGVVEELPMSARRVPSGPGTPDRA